MPHQILGIIYLMLPVIVFFQFFPSLLSNIFAHIFCSCAVGLHVFFVSKIELTKLITSLQFSPSEEHNDRLNNIIASCNVDPQRVELRYAFCYNNIALAAKNMIVLDPILWSEMSQDPEALKVVDIFEKFIEPGLSVKQKKYLTSSKNILTPPVQAFIFKHELGHVVQKYSHKKLFVNALIGFSAAYSGIFAAHLSYSHLHGLATILIGASVGFVSDFLFTFLSNVTFKLHAEKAADRFAAKHSSSDEISAAAEFFERHQEIIDVNPWAKDIFSKLPSVLKSGHLHGKSRKRFLLDLAGQK